MLNFMSNFNATKKLSVTSALFSLLFLFCSSICGLCAFASNPNDNKASGKGREQRTFSQSAAKKEDAGENSLYIKEIEEKEEEEEAAEEEAYESSLFETRNPNIISRLTSTPYNKRPTLNLNKPSKQ